jgi:hypothetical protein
MVNRLSIVCIVLAFLTLAIAPVMAQDEVTETAVQFIELAGPVADRDAEISSLVWYEDYLILMTENPFIYVEGGYAEDFSNAGAYAGMFFALPKADILAYLEAEEPEPLEPMPLPIVAPDIRGAVSGFVVAFDGFEAAAFVDDSIFLLIEADSVAETSMRAFMVAGQINLDLGLIVLDLENFAAIPRQTDFNNMSYESLFAADGQLVALYETNGSVTNEAPLAYVVDPAEGIVETVPFPNVDYRITDATSLDDEGVFWATNYFFAGEDFMAVEDDTAEALFAEYGMGASQAEFDGFERLVAFQYSAEGITLVEQAPIQLLMTEESNGRNWEGIARLDDMGFLIATDKYPQTILGFVPVE